jgi:hypothetical protein
VQRSGVLAGFPRGLIVVALASSIGLHWTFLQVVAWTGMVLTYSQEVPVTEAVVKTFDGKHPCSLCKEIAKGKHSEKETDYKFECAKLKFSYAPVTFLFTQPSAFWEIVLPDDFAELLTHAPPVPPPRTLPG